MEALVWIAQLVVLLVLWKLVHLLFWNLRKMLGNKSLLLTMLITVLIAAFGVLLAHADHTAWWQIAAFGIVLGLASGEYEYNRRLSD